MKLRLITLILTWWFGGIALAQIPHRDSAELWGWLLSQAQSERKAEERIVRERNEQARRAERLVAERMEQARRETHRMAVERTLVVRTLAERTEQARRGSR